MPVSVSESGGAFCLSASSAIEVDLASPELMSIGNYLAAHLQPATGYSLNVISDRGEPGVGNIRLSKGDVTAGQTLFEEGYELSITGERIILSANQPAGLFRGVQTLRQLLPPLIEHQTIQPGPWAIATGTIRDYPRFGYRGAMLDVARHFFPIEDLKRFVELIAYYKINRFHVHLSDDQGWRIAIKSWPDLTAVGGSTQVGGSTGSLFYSQEQFADLVAYAAQRYIVVIPEIDMPAHTNAALASYAGLNCNDIAPPLYTGTDVGFSSLCIGKESTNRFLNDVIGEIAQMTPGPYVHVGGDEARTTSAADYAQFIQSTQATVLAAHKRMIGWAEVGRSTLASSTVAQHWNPYDVGAVKNAVAQHVNVIMSPANRCYLDMKYDASTSLGLSWAGFVDEQKAYSWDPATEIAGIVETDILGVESPLWTETVISRADVDTMTFPRLAGHAEIGWSKANDRSWDEYKVRIASHGPRLAAMGVAFYKSSRIPWL